FVLLLFDFWPLGRLSVQSAIEKIPMLAITIASSVITFIAQRRGGAVVALAEFPFGTRVANALTAYVGYIEKMLWPVKLAVIYPYPKSIPAWQVGAAIL